MTAPQAEIEMDMLTLKDALERHRAQLLQTMERSERQRAQLQHELAVHAQQGTSFEAMRPVHDQIADVARDYWTAYGRVMLIDQMLEALRGERRLAFDEAVIPTHTPARQLNPWARCAEETCPPFPPWV